MFYLKRRRYVGEVVKMVQPYGLSKGFVHAPKHVNAGWNQKNDEIQRCLNPFRKSSNDDRLNKRWVFLKFFGAFTYMPTKCINAARQVMETTKIDLIQLQICPKKKEEKHVHYLETMAISKGLEWNLVKSFTNFFWCWVSKFHWMISKFQLTFQMKANRN